MKQCNDCKAPIMLAQHQRTNNYAPLDPDPSPDGNILWDRWTNSYQILQGEELERAKEQGIDLFLSHRVSCTHPRLRQSKNRTRSFATRY